MLGSTVCASRDDVIDSLSSFHDCNESKHTKAHREEIFHVNGSGSKAKRIRRYSQFFDVVLLGTVGYRFIVEIELVGTWNRRSKQPRCLRFLCFTVALIILR